MVRERIQRINYDANNDILYIKFPNDRGASYASDGPRGLEIMRDMETDELTGIMVYYARTKKEERQQAINSLGLGIDIDHVLMTTT